MTKLQICMEDVWFQHHLWWDRLTGALKRVTPIVTPKPSLVFFAGPSKWAGRYRSLPHRITYSLPYALLNSYEETIAHEMCHAFAKRIEPKSAWHGELFRFLMQHGCGFADHACCHDYNVKQAETLGRALQIELRLRPIKNVITSLGKDIELR